MRFRPRPKHLADQASLVGLVLLVLVSFRGAVLHGFVAFEADTLRFYYPLEVWAQNELQAGRFPLWNAQIFGGYPQFADGEMGLAYPLHLLLLSLLPVDQAFIGLRVSSVVIAAVGMFCLCRALKLGPLPALAGAIVFSLGSFFPAQVHHENMARSAAWAPITLAFLEWGFQRHGWQRIRCLALAGACLGMSALGLHPQAFAMTALAAAGFVTWRAVFGVDAASESLPFRINAAKMYGRRAFMAMAVIAYVLGLGLALGAVQLLPLVEIAASTFRATQPDYLFATSYAFPPPSFLTVLFPYFYRGPESQFWSLWSHWETTLYVGVIPLLLGLFGAARFARSIAGYFLALAVVALWLALASYAHFDLYRLLWDLPGFSALRVPARYTFLFVLGWSVLAAYGVQALGVHAPASRRRVGLSVGLVLVAFIAVGGLAVGMHALRFQIHTNERQALEFVTSTYLSLRQSSEAPSAAEVLRGLSHSLDPSTPRTLYSLLLIAGAGLLLATAVARGSRGRIWQAGAISLTACDLLAFGTGLHHEKPAADLLARSAAVAFLSEHAADTRVANPVPLPSVEANRLAAFGIEDLGGYSSVESRRSFAFREQVASTQNQLLDLASVRYVIYPAAEKSYPSYRNVPFDPERPLMVGARGSIGGVESFSFDGIPAHRIQVVAALTHATTIPQDEIVAEITVVPMRGPEAKIQLLAGRDVAEWAYDRADAVGKAHHARPDTIAFRREAFDPVFNQTYDLYLFYSEHDLPVEREMEVKQVDIRLTSPDSSFELYGLGLYNWETRQTEAATQRTRSNFRSVFRDAEAEIFENQRAFPRAYIVPNAMDAPLGPEAIGFLLYAPMDPKSSVLLDSPGADGSGEQSFWTLRGEPGAQSSTPIRPAHLVESNGASEVYRVDGLTGGFLVRSVSFAPGWRAWVDGVEAPVMRANYLFQAVAIPAGSHEIELRYEPRAVVVGLWLSASSALIALIPVGVGIGAQRRTRTRKEEVRARQGRGRIDATARAARG